MKNGKRWRKKEQWEKDELQSDAVKQHTPYMDDQGLRLTGVTTILGNINKPGLVKWAYKLGWDKVDMEAYVAEMGKIGKLAHAMCTNHLINEDTDMSDFTPNQVAAAERAFASFRAWLERNPINPIWVEKPLVDGYLKYGGTADIYCEMDGGVKTIIDLKTGKGLYSEHYYQIATLKRLLALHDYDSERLLLLNIPRSPDENFQEHILGEGDTATGWPIFLDHLMHHWLRKGRCDIALIISQELHEYLEELASIMYPEPMEE